MPKALQSLLMLSCLLTLMTCYSRRSYEDLKLPPTPILAAQIYYGVIEKAYTHVRQEPKHQSSLVTVLRGGTIVEIISSLNKEETIDRQSGRWYQISFQGRRGWIFGTSLKVFNSLDTARNAARLPSKPNQK